MLCWHPISRRQHLLAKVLSKKAYQANKIVADDTPSWWQDAISMAVLGCRVIALERHPVMSCLLQTAYRYAKKYNEYFRSLALEFVHTDGIEWLRGAKLAKDMAYLGFWAGYLFIGLRLIQAFFAHNYYFIHHDIYFPLVVLSVSLLVYGLSYHGNQVEGMTLPNEPQDLTSNCATPSSFDQGSHHDFVAIQRAFHHGYPPAK